MHEENRVSDGIDALKALEDWRSEEKCRSVKIEIDDGYGATCWMVELSRGTQKVCCSETTFVKQEGIDARWLEDQGNLYCCVVDGEAMEDWPGLAATIEHAIKCASKFFKTAAARDDSSLIWSTATCGELLRRLNAKCVEHADRGELQDGVRYAWLAGMVKDAMKEVGLDKESTQ